MKIEVEVPDWLAEQALKEGLFNSNDYVNWLLNQLHARNQVPRLHFSFEVLSQSAAAPDKDRMTPEEVEEEIQRTRKERGVNSSAI